MSNLGGKVLSENTDADEIPESVESGAFVTYSQFGADPTGAADSAAAIQNAIDFAAVNRVELRGEKGTFKVLSRLLIPKQTGFRWTMPRGCILDSSTATSAFYTIDAYSDRVIGESSDFTEGLIIDGGMVKPSPIAGSYGIALFYVLNTSRLSNIEVRGGANGILVSKMFYGFMDNIKIKDATATGLHIIGLSVDSGFNANPLHGLFIIGCKNNLILDNSEPTSSSNAVTFSDCTFENSVETSVIIKGVRPIKMTTCYFEGNYTDGAPTGVPVNIGLDDTHLELDNCFINTNLGGHNSAAYAVGLISGASNVRIVDKNTFKRKGVLTDFYPTDKLVTFESDAPNVDMSNPGGQYDRKRNAAGDLNHRVIMMDTISMAKTIAPIAGNLSSMNTVAVASPREPVTLLELDFTTAQLRSGWTCTISAIAFESNSVNATRRGGAVEIHISAFKDGSIFKAYGDITNERILFSSLYGEWFIQDDGVSKVYLGYAPLHASTAFTQDVQYQVHDMVCRTSSDIVSININPAIAMPTPTPLVKVSNETLKPFMYGVFSITASGGAYTKETSYLNSNVNTVARQVTGELRILPIVASLGSLKGIPHVNGVRGLSATTPYIWKIRTLASAGEVLISAYDKDTGAQVDVNAFTDTQLISVSLDTMEGE